MGDHDVHRFHPDPEEGDPSGGVLFDECHRCAHWAMFPERVDDATLIRLYERTGRADATKNERHAQDVIRRAVDLSRRVLRLTIGQEES